MASPQTLEPAHLVWEAGDHPVSADYGDVYYSREGGLGESEHVFLAGNQLAERWARADRERGDFVVVETGFGTGLNFLLTAERWLETQSAQQRLRYVAIEGHPLRHEDLQRVLRAHPTLDGRELLRHYPGLASGTHHLPFEANLDLTLIHLELGSALGELSRILADTGAVDAWFLDGFSPRRNPSMWTSELYRAMASETCGGGTFSTYTASGAVRDGLRSAGFVVEIAPGYGAKHDMLRGRLAPGVKTQ